MAENSDEQQLTEFDLDLTSDEGPRRWTYSADPDSLAPGEPACGDMVIIPPSGDPGWILHD